MHRDLEWVRSAVDGILISPTEVSPRDPNVDLSLTTTDSRDCVAGSIYIARVGENADGHHYVPAAVQDGASLVIAERATDELGVPQVIVKDATVALGMLAKAHLADLRTKNRLTVAGVTGSAGKTTTKDLLARVAREFGPTVAPKLSFNNEVGCPLTVLEANESTRFIVLEMGASGPGHIAYLTEIAPLDVATVLMVGQAHLGGYASEQALADAKAELVKGLVPEGIAVLNVDDADVWAMRASAPGQVIGFSAHGDQMALYRAKDVHTDSRGRADFTLLAGDQELPVHLSLVGAHQVSNVLAAIATSQAMSLDLQTTVKVCESSNADSPHRMAVQQVDVPGGPRRRTPAGQFTLVDDSYNANPDSMRAAFNTVRRLAPADARVVMVLGEMLELGPESARIHREVGEAALQVGPSLIVQLGEGPLYAEPSDSSDSSNGQVTEHEPQEGACVVATVPNPTAAHKLLVEELQEGDVLLVKGSNGSRAWEVVELLLPEGSAASPPMPSPAGPGNGGADPQ